MLGQSLVRGTEDGDPQPENMAPRTQAIQSLQKSVNGGFPAMRDGTPRTASSDDWNLEFLEGADFDWNAFLTNDLSGFGFAPGGIV